MPYKRKPKKKSNSKKSKNSKKSTAQKIWCNLTQTDVRRMIVFFGMSRDLRISDIPTHQEPNKLCSTFKKMFKAPCIKNWDILKYVGSGLYGQVYSCKHADGRLGVVKIQYGDTRKICSEIKLQKKFHKKKFAPKIYDYCSFSPKNVMGNHLEQIAKEIGEDVKFSDYSGSNRIHLIFMEPVDGVLTSWLSEKKDEKFMKSFVIAFVVLLNNLKRSNLTHSDLHPSNLGYRYLDSNKVKVELVPIDFGLARSGTANMELEILKFIRTIHPKYMRIHPENRKYLFDTMRRVSQHLYNIEIPKCQKEIEKKYYTLRK